MRNNKMARTFLILTLAYIGGFGQASAQVLPPPLHLTVVLHNEEPPDADLNFIPDAGIRVDNAALPAPGVDVSGGIYLYYEDTQSSPPRQLVATSFDGLIFSTGVPQQNRANDPRRLLLPDGTWRLYLYDPRTVEMKSSGSRDGLFFTPDFGVRYRPHAGDNGTLGVYDHFTDSAGGVVLLYVGDMMGLNNVRRAYSPPGDNGWTFTFERGNVLGDSLSGGGPNSYVDQKSIRLPDARRRLFTMRQGIVYSFISNDDGKTFTREPGIRLQPSDFNSLKIISLHDPWVVRLPNGRYRMYLASMIRTGTNTFKFAIISATTAPLTSTTGDGNSTPESFKLMQNYPNPFNPSTKLSFVIGHSSLVTLKVFDVLGREVATLVNGELNPGEHSVVFSAKGLVSGVYFYRLSAGSFIETKKMLISK